MELLTQIHVVYFLPPYRPRYVSTVFFVKKKVDHLFNLPTSLESLLGIY